MADEVKTEVKDAVVEASTTTVADSPVTTPVAEQATTKTSETVPYDRFQEVIKQKNGEIELRKQYEARIKELEIRQASGPAAPDKAVQRLVALGLKEDVAKAFAETNREEIRAAIAPLQARENSRSMDSWIKDIERSDPDYKKLKPQLEKAFDALSDDAKRLAVSSPQGLEWFYKSVKSDVLGDEVTKARAAGVKEGYENKDRKAGMGSSPKSGTSVEEPLSFESIRGGAIKKMSDSEYAKRLPEINAILAKGPSRK